MLPEFREYERTLDGVHELLRAPDGRRLRRPRSSRALRDLGTGGELNILRSDAGVMTPREAARNPVYGVLSGPSGGVAGALHVAARAGYPNILTFDMGGTSTDVSLCRGGEPTIGRETTIGQFKIKVPSVDVHTVGAGGGSIAHVPGAHAARCASAPSRRAPTPARRRTGAGGEAPTVTDANVVVGHLPPRLIGGEMTLDVEQARAAVQKIADATGLSLDAAAEGILAIANETMAGALRLVSVQRGHDPRELALVAFGGAGPAARERGRGAHGLVPGDRAAVAGAAVRARRPRRRLPQRVRPHADPADERGDGRGDPRDPRRARGPRARVDGRARTSRPSARA